MSAEASPAAAEGSAPAAEEVDYTFQEGGEEGGEVAELEAMLQEMEEGQTKIAEASTQASAQASSVLAAKAKLEEQKAARDERSVFVQNVDFKTTGEELSAFFGPCGAVERVTIVADKFGHPKGFAYVEFADKSAVENALVLSGTLFKDRALKIITKRTNVPSFQLRGRGGRGGAGYSPRGRGGFFRGGGGGGYAPRGGFRGGYAPRGGGGFRGRGRGRGGY